MAINLNTLTSPATSGDVLAEALTTADFLEGVPVLRNLARGSQKGGDAKQGTALNQPKALPLDANGKGYLYLSGVSGNYASVPKDAILNGITSFVMEAKNVYMGDWATAQEEIFLSNYANGNNAFVFGRNGSVIWLYALYGGNVTQANFAHGLTGAATASVRLTRAGTSVTAELDTGSGYAAIGSSQTVPSVAIDDNSNPLEIGTYNNGVNGKVTGKISQVRIWNNATASGTPVLDVDFTATNVRHGDTKFKCATGQVVTINKSGNDPATIIKKSVLRFANKSDDSTNISLAGLFNQTITDGYMFAAFSVLGDGGEGNGRVFSVDNGNDNSVTGGIFSLGATNNLRSYYKGGLELDHIDLFDDALGNVLHDVKLTTGSQVSKVNNADQKTATSTGSLTCVNFNISSRHDFDKNAALDLEYLALFPATITDAQADSVRNYINNRNNVFSLIDSQGYYFFDGAATSANQVFTGSSSWPGRIVGSDNDDIFKYLSNPTHNDRPTTDGYKINFADNSDHFLFNTPLTGGQAGWQIVGTSLGTFAYRVDSDAVTELNLLGNAGTVRSIGDLYGIILLPASATGKDIEDARKLLIDRGAADAASVTSVEEFWRNRSDIVEFNHVNFTNVTNFLRAWRDANSINNFGAINAPNGNNFSGAWEGCDSLLSFPAGAKLGTSANNVNFTSTWQENGLTSFPALDLSKGINMSYAWYNATSLSSFGAIDARGCTNFFNAWNGCSALTSFPAGAKLGTAASNVNFTSAWKSSGLTSFELDLSTGTTFTNTFRSSALTSFGGCDLSKGIHFKNTFYLCSNLTEISASAKFGTDAVNVDFDSAFASTGLTSFPALDLSNGTKFYATWFGNNSMSEFGAIDASLGATFADAFKNCSALQSFPSEAKLGTNANNVVFSETWRSNGLTSFSTPLNTGAYFFRAWRDCSSLVDFSAEVLTNWNPSSITTGVFNEAWDGCAALSAQSVENILTSIDVSGQYATSTGASGGSALADAGIDIDYNTATGSLSAATNAAVTSLKAKGWSIIVNNVTL